MRVGGEVDGAGQLIFVEHATPALAAVGTAKHTALGIGAEGMAHGGHQNDIRIDRIHDHRPDLPCIGQTQIGPSLACIGRLEHPAAPGHIAAHVGFAGADIEDVGIAARHRDGADGRGFLGVEYGLPGCAGIDGLPDPACGCAKVENIR